jgi:sulfur carrier protein ThiS
MPSPRAVLSDIHDFGLNPKESWSAVGKKGRLKKPQDSTLDEVKLAVETMVEVKEPEIINVPVQPEPIVDVQVESEEQEWADLVRQVELEQAGLAVESNDESLTTPEFSADSTDDLELSRSKKKKK